MPSISIVRESKINRTARVMQVEGIFDIPLEDKSRESWSIDFEFPDRWNVGVIVGPSGSGKTTIAKEIFGDSVVDDLEWNSEKSLLDDFSRDLGIKEITGILSRVGFSSPPSWVKPYNVLSNGEKFRATIARAIVECNDIVVIDEFTSVVDRTVAQIGSHAVSKYAKKNDIKFVAVSCHYDILEWLEPDWVYDVSTNDFDVTRGRLRRPKIELEVKRVPRYYWSIFKKHHYLSSELNVSSRCFCALIEDRPAAFASILHFPHAKSKNIKREHRIVCLPDFQGVGIGNALSDFVGSMLTGIGYRYISQTSHPAMIGRRNRSKNWVMKAKPTSKQPRPGKSSTMRKLLRNVRNRNVASFEYIGDKISKQEALRIYNG